MRGAAITAVAETNSRQSWNGIFERAAFWMTSATTKNMMTFGINPMRATHLITLTSSVGSVVMESASAGVALDIKEAAAAIAVPSMWDEARRTGCATKSLPGYAAGDAREVSTHAPTAASAKNAAAVMGPAARRGRLFVAQPVRRASSHMDG